MPTKVEVTKNGKKYSYDYERIVVLLDENNADHLRRYADKFFPKLNGKGNINHSVRHILNTVFELSSNPEIVRMIKDDTSLNDDICMMLRKITDAYIKQQDAEIEDASFGLY